ncbi:MAG: hypothetical protein COW02_12420 [Comamonadaceae bacterium CG12_big_fil_rev_8_21_14_0_65_59_15]|nr:MAG: hypothetical protein COW02_12420 [Comamonadaceae bacterium CG12_big_fil_rev_8_21_14_0_65_59_15]
MQPLMTDSYWSIAGAAVIKICSTLRTVKLRVAMSALEKTILEVDDRLRVFRSCSRPKLK